MNRNHFWPLLLIVMVAAACKFSGSETNVSEPTKGDNARPPASNVTNTPASSAAAAETAAKGAACPRAAMPGKVFVAKQSFAFDHEPFKGSCFVTFASAEDMVDQGDVPRGSTFHIFKDGKKVYDLPDAFGGQSACWVEAVSFKDLNADGRTDIIMAGKCLGARDSYTTNAVYANLDNGFMTDDAANSRIEEMKTAAEIEAYVKRHVDQFF